MKNTIFLLTIILFSCHSKTENIEKRSAENALKNPTPKLISDTNFITHLKEFGYTKSKIAVRKGSFFMQLIF